MPPFPLISCWPEAPPRARLSWASERRCGTCGCRPASFWSQAVWAGCSSTAVTLPGSNGTTLWTNLLSERPKAVRPAQVATRRPCTSGAKQALIG